jgi:hypothetical protein
MADWCGPYVKSNGWRPGGGTAGCGACGLTATASGGRDCGFRFWTDASIGQRHQCLFQHNSAGRHFSRYSGSHAYRSRSVSVLARPTERPESSSGDPKTGRSAVGRQFRRPHIFKGRRLGTVHRRRSRIPSVLRDTRQDLGTSASRWFEADSSIRHCQGCRILGRI